MNFKNKNVLVVGFGCSGQAAVRFLRSEGAHVAVTDVRPQVEIDGGISGGERILPPMLSRTSGFAGGGGIPMECHWGGHSPEIFEGRDLIVVSPGVPLTIPGLVLARKKKIPVIGEFGLAASLLRSPMIAVTGTNGKSTTVTLIAKMLEQGGKKVALAGNIGKPLLEVVLENKSSERVLTGSGFAWPGKRSERSYSRLTDEGFGGRAGSSPDWIVAEVSSYQLETAPQFHPKIAVLLNITEDHLDRYSSLKEYARAKFQIFKHQSSRDTLIYKEDDPIIKKGVRQVRARKIGFSLKKNLAGETILYGKEKYLLSRVKLVGLHNAENMMAAITAARLAGSSSEAVQKTLESFPGLPHRTAFVRELDGVCYYDDSKGTNVDAVVKSLAGFPDGRVILIAGGRDKGGSYEPLRQMAMNKTKLVIALGESRTVICKAMKNSVPVETVERLEEAVPLARSRAISGDVVLLSPACSSFDQFKDYKERGELFQELVRQL